MKYENNYIPIRNERFRNLYSMYYEYSTYTGSTNRIAMILLFGQLGWRNKKWKKQPARGREATAYIARSPPRLRDSAA